MGQRITKNGKFSTKIIIIFFQIFFRKVHISFPAKKVWVPLVFSLPGGYVREYSQSNQLTKQGWCFLVSSFASGMRNQLIILSPSLSLSLFLAWAVVWEKILTSNQLMNHGWCFTVSTFFPQGLLFFMFGVLWVLPALWLAWQFHGEELKKALKACSSLFDVVHLNK